MNEELTQELGALPESMSSDTPGTQPSAAGPVENTAPQYEEIILGQELTDDDLSRVYKRLGRPDKAEDYDLKEIVPDTFNQGVVEEFKNKAFELGVSQDNAKKLAQWYKETQEKQINDYQRARQEASDRSILQLKAEWGSRFDEEVKYALKARDAYADADFKQYMNETGLGDHPALVKAFAKIGRELSEDRLVQSDTAVRMAKNSELKRAEIQRLRENKDFMAQYRRGEPSAVQRLNRLYLED